MPAARNVIRITLRGETVDVDPYDYGARDDDAVVQATRKAKIEARTLTSILNDTSSGNIGLQHLAVLWWIARRKVGIREDLGAVLDAWPTWGEMNEGGILDATVVEIDPNEADDDQAADAGLAGEAADPLLSAAG